MRIGLVLEGPYDQPVFEALIRTVWPEAEFQRLTPDIGGLTGWTGWQGVRAWCKEHGPRLKAFMKGIRGRELDLLVIHADCSMSQNEGARRACPPARDTANALQLVIQTSWLAGCDCLDLVRIATPAQTTEAWLVAALDPPYSAFKEGAELECVNAGQELVRRKLVKSKDGKLLKRGDGYMGLIGVMVSKLAHCRRTCSELDRFLVEIV